MGRVQTHMHNETNLSEPLLQRQASERSAGDSSDVTNATGRSSTTAWVPPSTASHGAYSSCWFSWVTPLLQRGSKSQLQADDLLQLDPSMQPGRCGRQLWLNWSKELLMRPARPSLLWALAKTYGRPYAWLGLLKLLNDLLGFSGPLLLQLLVAWLTTPPAPSTSSGAAATAQWGPYSDRPPLTPGWSPQRSPHTGWICVALLALSTAARALLNAHFNFQLSRLSCQMRAGLMCVLYRKSLLAVRYDMTAEEAAPPQSPSAPQQRQQQQPLSDVDIEAAGVDLSSVVGGSSGVAKASAAASASGSIGGGGEDVSTLMSVDTGRAVNLLLSFHELWSLPCQFGLALYLLYTQVRYAFLAGLVVSMLLVPVNRAIAKCILAASAGMMAAKDTRVAAMSELLRGIRAIKMQPAWEGFYIAKVAAARRRELRGLAVRKYLDALCVYFWAATSLLFSALTFGLVVALGGAAALTPAVAFTSLSLFQLLTGPLNAFPWVLNGVVEAVVSVRRLQRYLCRSETKALWAYDDLQLNLRDLPPKPAAVFLAAATLHTDAGTGSRAATRDHRCGLIAALKEARAAEAAAAAAAAAAGGGGYGGDPLNRMLGGLRLPPAVAAALRWRSRVVAARGRVEGAAQGFKGACSVRFRLPPEALQGDAGEEGVRQGPYDAAAAGARLLLHKDEAAAEEHPGEGPVVTFTAAAAAADAEGETAEVCVSLPAGSTRQLDQEAEARTAAAGTSAAALSSAAGMSPFLGPGASAPFNAAGAGAFACVRRGLSCTPALDGPFDRDAAAAPDRAAGAASAPGWVAEQGGQQEEQAQNASREGWRWRLWQSPLGEPLAAEPAQGEPDGAAASFCSATLSWGEAARPCLYDICLAIPRGRLTVLVGRVGAGKSSLLTALLGGGELPVLAGSVRTFARQLSYAPQHPWITTGTVRANVLLGLPLDERLYLKVLEDCALEPDLAAMPAGDLTPVGDNGCNLSGGQRARVGLARALYHAALSSPAAAAQAAAAARRAALLVARRGGTPAELRPLRPPAPLSDPGDPTGFTYPAPDPDLLVLLDDVLASLDRCSAAHVVQHALLGPLLLPARPGVGSAPDCLERLWAASLDHGSSLDHDPGPAAGPTMPDLSGLALEGGLAPPRAHPSMRPVAGSTRNSSPSSSPTVVVASNDPRVIAAAALVVALEAGRVTYVGSPAGYLATGQHCLARQPHPHPHGHNGGRSYSDDGAEGSVSGCNGGGEGEAAVRVRGQRRAGNSEDVDGGLTGQGFQGGRRLSSSSSSSNGGLGHTTEDGPSDGSYSGSDGGGESASRRPSRHRRRRRPPSEVAAAAGERDTEGEEDREVGHVRWRVYDRYMAAVGRGVVAAVLLSLTLMQGSRNASDLWVSYFAAHRTAASAAASPGAPAATAAIGPFLLLGATATAAMTCYGNCSKADLTLRAPASDLALGSGSGVRTGSNPAKKFGSYWSAAAAAQLPATWHWCALAAGAPGLPYTPMGAGPVWLPAGAAVCPAAAVALAPEAAAVEVRPSPLLPAGELTAAATAGNSTHRGQRVPGAAAVEAARTAASEFMLEAATVRRRATAADGDMDESGDQLPCVGGGPGGGLYGMVWSPRLFLTGLVAIAAANTVFTMARAFTFALAGMRAAKQLHERLLAAVLAAPMAFFDTVPHGRILNRFSSDVSTADDSLPFILNIALANVASLAGLLAVLCYSAPLLLPLLLPLALLYRRLQLYYRSSSREVRRLEALALSPVYGTFGVVAEAAPLIRAFGAQRHFLTGAVRAVTQHQRAAITSGAASAWLALRLQLLASLLVAAVAGLAVWRSSGSGNGSSSSGNSNSNTGGRCGEDLVASLAGLSLSYALPVVGLLNGLLTSTAETEQEMVAVERLEAYIELQPQPLTLQPALPQPTAAVQQPAALTAVAESRAHRAVPQLPQPSPVQGVAAAGQQQKQRPTGVVQFEDVVVRYRPERPPALAGLSLEVAAGEHLGVVGRTGAGKSSVVAALLRLVEVESGRVLLYGEDIRAVQLPRLRSSIGVLPQSPLLVSATLRENLDPEGPAAGPAKPLADAALCGALRLVGLWDVLAAAAVHRRRSRQRCGPDGAAAVDSSSAAETGDGAGTAPGATAATAAGPAGFTTRALTLTMATAAEVLGLPLGSLPGAVGLSAGQQQLLCLARLLLRPRRLVLLDECSAHVDPATASSIRQLVSELLLLRRSSSSSHDGGSGSGSGSTASAPSASPHTAPRTALASSGTSLPWPLHAVVSEASPEVLPYISAPCAVLEVAHDLAAVGGCDRVVVLEGGRAVEVGPPKELLGLAGGRFRLLHGVR